MACGCVDGDDADLDFLDGLAGEGGVLQREQVGGSRDGLEPRLQETAVGLKLGVLLLE
ncbi:hypothetical protein [Streptomyces sp. NPDC057889]|uniref:hypothetical protein n=1 Tax=unclassified Streptomyces TaxID=2593676 RepID=UPI0036898355